jgi:pilus assembly protein CpaE
VTGFGSPPDPRAEPIPTAAMRRMLGGLKEAFPFTVVDATSEYSDHVLTTLETADAVCLVTGLDVIGVKHLSIGIHTLERLGIPRDRFRIVLNRADSKVDLSSIDIEKNLGIKVDARIPSSPLVPRSINHGRLLLLEEPRSEVARSIESFAAQLCDGFGAAADAVPGGRRRSWRRS